jgi:hypothetical protein
MAPSSRSIVALSLLLARASADNVCTADGLESRLTQAQDFAATANGKCNSKDACYAMMQMDQLCADGKFDKQWCDPAVLGDLGYYSPFKVKQSMIDGGQAADSTACSFGKMAELSRKGLITSNCADDIADPNNPDRGAIINMFTNYWCPYVLTNSDLMCSVDHGGRETKFAVMDCDSVPHHIEHPDLLMADQTFPTERTTEQMFSKLSGLFFVAALVGVSLVAAAIGRSARKARSEVKNDYAPLLAA